MHSYYHSVHNKTISQPRLLQQTTQTRLGQYPLLLETTHSVQLSNSPQPMPQHSLIFGHAFVVNSLLRSLPKDANIMYLCFEILRQSSRSDSLVYLNLWPFNSPLMVIWSPAACFQTTQEYNLPKPKAYHDILAPVTGGASLISMKNEQWRHWRTILNPGFSPGSLLDHVSYIVDEVTVFVDILRQYAQRGDLFRMEDKTVWLTLDIVGRVIM